MTMSDTSANLRPAAQKDTELIHGGVERGTKIICYLEEDQSEFLEEPLEGFGEDALRAHRPSDRALR